jgi:hypothetical protein
MTLEDILEILERGFVVFIIIICRKPHFKNHFSFFVQATHLFLMDHKKKDFHILLLLFMF